MGIPPDERGYLLKSVSIHRDRADHRRLQVVDLCNDQAVDHVAVSSVGHGTSGSRQILDLGQSIVHRFMIGRTGDLDGCGQRLDRAVISGSVKLRINAILGVESLYKGFYNRVIIGRNKVSSRVQPSTYSGSI